MKKTLFVALMVMAGTSIAQEVKCESKFAAELKMISAICFTNDMCEKEIAQVKACLPEDYTDRNGNTVKGTIAKFQTKIAENNKQIAIEKKQASAPGARIGMTPKQVINDTTWGAPTRVNRTTTASGVREQWVYDHCGYNRCYGGYLYFTNGVLTAIQN
jgi:hypothetical protein